MTEEQIFALEKPDQALLKLYFIRSLLALPLFLITFPLFFIRYHTLRYKFDHEGISMSWGLLFKKEVNLTYTRIQDIHLTSGFLQRWLGLADIQIQTASGNAAAEMVIEGLKEFEDIRTFIYGKMRGHTSTRQGIASNSVPASASNEITGSNEVVEVLNGILNELKAARSAVENLNRNNPSKIQDSESL